MNLSTVGRVLLGVRPMAFLLAVSMTVNCKTQSAGATNVKDFDTGANADLEIKFDDDFSFCPNAKKFNVVNAYWLTLASAYVYATKGTLQGVAAEIKTKWPSLNVEFLASPDSVNPLEPSTQALWIETDSAAVLAFRGTPLDRIDVQDIVSDANALLVPFDAQESLGKVHKGFKKALDGVWSLVEPKVLKASEAQKPLFVTGHSLGAALASLTVARLTMLSRYQAVRPIVRGLYTLGSPRIGNDDFVAKFRAAMQAGPEFPIVRFRNGQDIVTRVPPSVLGYKQHLSNVYFLAGDADGRISSDDSVLGMARYKMNAITAGNMVETAVPTAFSDLKEHLPTAYFAKISAEYAQIKDWAQASNGDICDDDAAFYQTPATPDLGAPPAVTTLDDLKKLKNHELAVLFAGGKGEPIPSAKTPGTAVDGTGLPIIRAGNATLNGFAFDFWEGKKFTTDENGKTTLVNKLAGNWVNDVSADVYPIAEGLNGDGKPSILLDYSKSNRKIARAIRDEIRQIAPGVYLGRANLQNPQALWPMIGRYRFVIWFALGFPD